MSEKSISQKMFIKPASRFLLVNPPNGYLARLGELPHGVVVLNNSSTPVEVIQEFVANLAELEQQHPKLTELKAPKGMLWVTYHKDTSKVKTDINRDTIYAYAYMVGMDGVAMCSFDEDWSAFRLKSL